MATGGAVVLPVGRTMSELKVKYKNLQILAIKMINQVYDATRTLHIGESDLEVKLHELEYRLKKLAQLKDQLNDMQKQMMEDPSFNEQEYEVTEELEFRMDSTEDKGRAKLDKIKREWQIKQGLLVNDGSQYSRERSASVGSLSSGQLGNGHVSHRNLPKLEVQKFNGDHLKWVSFWESFKNDVDQHPELVDGTKLRYLRMALTDKINNDIEPFGNQYSAIVRYLCKKYGNTEVLIKVNTDALNRRVPVRNEEDVYQLQELNNFIRTRVKALTDLGVSVSSFYHTVGGLLPKRLFVAYRMAYPTERDIDHLIDYVDQLIETMELAGSDSEERPVNEQPRRRYSEADMSSQGRRVASAAMLPVAQVGGGQVVPPQPCVLCKDSNHRSWNCSSQLTLLERRQNLISQGRCLTCLRLGHQQVECRARFSDCRVCRQHHVVSMCPVRVAEFSMRRSTEPVAAVQAATLSVTNHELYILKTLQVVAWMLTDRVPVVCLIDEGSQRTFVTRRVVQRLQLTVNGRERLTTSAFGGPAQTQWYDRVEICLSDPQSSSGCLKLRALVMETAISYQTPKMDDVKELMNFFAVHKMAMACQFSIYQDVLVEIVIGIDSYDQVMTGRMQKVGKTVMAMETVFGWVVQGKQEGATPTTNCGVTCVVSVDPLEGDDMARELQNLWSLEAIGVREVGEETKKQIEQNVSDEFGANLRMSNGRYVVQLPWLIGKQRELNDNWFGAMARLRSLVRKLERQPGALDAYHEAIQSYLRDEHAERIPYDDRRSTTYYMPHRPVYREGGSTSLRVVFDASAREWGHLSLNDCIHPGANRQLDLVKILLKFRQGRVAAVADLRKAFLQIEVCEEDRDYLRYLWFDTVEDAHNFCEENVRVFRMTRVIFGLTASPFLLRAVLETHAERWKKDYPLAYVVILREFYVDDVVTSDDNEDGVSQKLAEVEQVMEKAGFKLHKVVRSGDVSEQQVKVLGVVWEPAEDQLRLAPAEMVVVGKEPITKRIMLKTSAAIYDPLGLMAPLVVQARILFQKAWKEDLRWDDVVSPELAAEWMVWRERVSEWTVKKVPRYMGGQMNLVEPADNNYSLHFFSDASPQAYGVVVYLVTTDGDGMVRSVVLVLSRFRVAPVKYITLPRLELLAALLSARVNNYLTSVLDCIISTRYFWTDSEIALFWITSFKYQYATFVANRVEEIRRYTDASRWYHCPGVENPADLATKLWKTKKTPSLNLWWDGPVWLQEGSFQDRAVQHRATGSAVDKSRLEVCESRVGVSVVSVVGQPIIGLSELFDLSDVSSYQKLKDKTAAIVRASKKWRGVWTSRVDDIREAERLWFREVQREWREVNDGCEVVKSTFKERGQLRLYLDGEGIVRLSSRLVEGDWAMDFVRPILLPRDHRLTELVVDGVHASNCHVGVSTTLALVRQRFWVPRGRVVARKVVQRCVVCRMWNQQAHEQPIANLPSFRVDWSQPFLHVGVDFAGPVFLKEGRTSSVVIKGYIALFTCATSRAVHLELTTSLSTDDFILAFRRFVSRRGVPEKIYSDNAATFRGSAQMVVNMQAVLGSARVQRYCEQRGIQWQFIVPSAPWWGGYWERMVGLIKGPLRRAMGRRVYERVSFETLLIEVEAIVNSRPLSVMYDDPMDLSVVTPAMLVAGRPLQLLEGTSVVPSKKVVEVQRMRAPWFGELQRRWKDYYLAFLRSAHVTTLRKEQLWVEGQVVLIMHHLQKRALWPLARVEQPIVGRDGVVRSCRVITSDGRRFTRPVNLLVLLEEAEEGPMGAPGSVVKSSESENAKVKRKLPEEVYVDECAIEPGKSPIAKVKD